MDQIPIPEPKILVVDDEPRMCKSLEFLFDTHNYQIRTAHSAREAMHCISKETFDVAVLDIVMPDMNGPQLMDRIIDCHPETSIIFITGNATVDSAVSALKKGAYDYLRKPFEFDELLNTVQNAITHKQLRREKDVIHSRLDLTETRYRFLVQTSPDIIYTLDDTGHFSFVSDAVSSILKYAPGELIDRHFTDIVHAADLERARGYLIGQRGKDQLSGGIELRLVPRNNPSKFKYCEIRAMAIDPKTGPGGVQDNLGSHRGSYGVIRDISENRRLQAELQQAERMEALGTLSGGIAHDFNNLLMAIQGNVSLVLMQLDEHSPESERLKNIERYIESGAKLTRQLLGFARGGAFEMAPIDPNALIHQSADLFAQTHKEIVIRKSLQEDLWSVDADRGQLEQMLLNLYLNAWQAMPDGGEIHITSRNQELHASRVSPQDLPPGRYVRIAVKDNGIGMDRETLKHIFEPFFTTKGVERGTGLGLASAYGIVKRHNGGISVTSAPSEGAKFVIHLPVSTTTAGLEDTETEPLPGTFTGTGTVLLVDDEEMIIDVGRAILESLGYRVAVARSGEEAVDYFGRVCAHCPKTPAEDNNGEGDDPRPALVILDMVMPGMGGKKACEKLRELDPDLKILISSGYNMEGVLPDQVENGANGFIQKPYRIDTLAEKLAKLLKNNDS